MHEILTLQLGQRANYIATHFWNTQESYFTYSPTAPPSLVDHDVHYRAGIGVDGVETFTPRTLIYDLKGGFGTLRKIGKLWEEVEGAGGGSGVWDGNVVIRQQEAIAQSEYQLGLEEGLLPVPRLTTETVRYWSDFNRVSYHPRSIVQLNDWEMGSSLMPFERWESGEELFKGLDAEVDLLDRDVRTWAEECDCLQGVQIFTSVDDAWGGFAAGYLERLRDEYGKGALWVWGVEEERGKGQRDKQLLRTVNAARSMHEISTHASMYIPMSIPPSSLPRYISLNRSSQWHTSALLSTAIETMTLPSRLRPGERKGGNLIQMEAALNVNGNQRVAKLQCSIPDDEDTKSGVVEASTKDYRLPQLDAGQTLFDEGDLQMTNATLDMDFFCTDLKSSHLKTVRQEHVFGQVDVYREGSESRDELGEEEGYSRKRIRLANLPICEKYSAKLRYPLLDSFPSIFPGRSDNIAVHTSLTTTSQVADRVKALQRVVGRMVGLDQREALSNGLGEMVEAYEEGWDSGSDDGSDDY